SSKYSRLSEARHVQRRSTHPTPRCGFFHLPGDLGQVIVKIMPQPLGEHTGFAPDSAGNLADARKVESADFRRVRLRAAAGESPEIYVDVLVLLQAVVEFGPVTRMECKLEWNFDPQFLAQAPPRGGNRQFAGPRMPAAGIRPQTPGVILAPVALLEKNTAFAV